LGLLLNRTSDPVPVLSSEHESSQDKKIERAL
jgi:hypothetical protein